MLIASDSSFVVAALLCARHSMIDLSGCFSGTTTTITSTAATTTNITPFYATGTTFTTCCSKFCLMVIWASELEPRRCVDGSATLLPGCLCSNNVRVCMHMVYTDAREREALRVHVASKRDYPFEIRRRSKGCVEVFTAVRVEGTPAGYTRFFFPWRGLLYPCEPAPCCTRTMVEIVRQIYPMDCCRRCVNPLLCGTEGKRFFFHRGAVAKEIIYIILWSRSESSGGALLWGWGIWCQLFTSTGAPFLAPRYVMNILSSVLVGVSF